MLDRIVWQDVDADRLTPEQLDALRGWVAAGGRLVIAGGTAGPRSLAAFPDTLLPYRPTATTDVPPAALSGLLGAIPDDGHGPAGARRGRSARAGPWRRSATGSWRPSASTARAR